MSINKTNKAHLLPAHSTFPVQDQFNQVHMFTGLSKLEWIAGTIAGGILSKYDFKTLTVSEYTEIIDHIISISTEILDQLNEIANQSEPSKIAKI